MLCDICGINPARTTITKITTQGRETIRLCEICAGKRQSRVFAAPRQETVNIVDYFSVRAKDVIQKAAGTAISLNHQTLDTEHLLIALCQEQDVAAKILRELGIKPEDLEAYLKNAIPHGSTEIEHPDLSPRAKRVLELAFDESRALNHSYVGSEHILLGLVQEDEGLAAQTLKKYAVDLVRARAAVIKLVGKGLEKGESAKEPSKTPTLDQFSRDLTLLAKKSKLDPVIGREKEISRVVNILSRRTKNNPVLIGEPGVGKTAIVEGLAMRIVGKDVPETLFGKRVLALDLAGMVAGTKYRGEFEERLKKTISEVLQAKKEVILFIDELHTLVGAGAAEGAIGAGNMLKPYLARGELQAVGATTLSEYKKYVEKDAALERRFQPIIVPENTIEETIEILRGLRDRYEAHHRVKILDEAILSAANLSDRYLKDRFLPDKAIDLIDEASAAVRLRSIAPPSNLEQAEKEVKKIKKELEAAKRAKQKEQIRKMEGQLKELEKIRDEIKGLWEKTKGMEQPEVATGNIAQVLSQMTGIPISKLTEEEKEKLLSLEKTLHKRIVGQDEAVKIVSQAIRRARAGLKDPKRPIGSFMFLGSTGVGKTELTKVLADILYGSEKAMVRLDMSEYQERHAVAKLIGSPPGYVGFEEGGQLTEKVRRQPFSIILFDEIEKAHMDVFNLLLQILEDGRLTDGKGRVVDFKNTILILTSNLGGKLIQKAQEEGKNQEAIEQDLEKLLKMRFNPEFLNRIDEFVIFKSLSKKEILQIVDLLLEETKKLARAQNVELKIEKKVKEFLAEQGFDPQYGARPLRRVIQREIEIPLADKLIAGAFDAGSRIKVGLGKKGEVKFSKL